ncbi:MAG: leucyl aminopeptidase family protein [Minwuia sp.]|uniref:leucyl aminopeptidase family protein n=1 Tax=Minwuia sp. TaxID=2493630 RepID=UPI003A8A8468
MSDFDLVDAADGSLPVHLVPASGLADWLAEQPETVRNWLDGRTSAMTAGAWARLPDAAGRSTGTLHVVSDTPDMWSIAGLQAKLKDGVHHLDLSAVKDPDPTALATGWALGTYRFDRYLKPDDKIPTAKLVWPEGADRDMTGAMAEGIMLSRNLINTPADDMGPSELEAAALALAERFGGTARSVVGDELLTGNFPMIHAVGRASDDPPRLVDLTFGDEALPKVTLVGKGVCFDTGGLDLKPASGMELMRKDMGGAGTALGLAHVLLATGAPIRLRVLLPMVENAVSGNAYRPGDILKTRKGLTVEIGNTDAEGRLILGDALTLASEENPALLIDFATLTGAARVAVGTEIAAYFTASDELGDEMMHAGRSAGEDVWRLPMHDGYRHLLNSPFADINNAGSGRFAGATTAALFLKEFVAEPKNWLHFDIMAWNSRARPGRPKGGEAMGLRAVHRLIMDRFG